MTDDYNAAQNSKDSYDLAIREMRLKKAAKRVERIGDATLYLGDCLEILPTLGKVDAVVTDPPYGIDYGRAGDFSASHGWGPWRENCAWDTERPKRDVFDAMRAISKEQIIWGGNYFTDYLPPTMHWLLWDKGQREFSLADFEIAWGSQKRAARVIVCPRGRAVKDGKEHPTQKPVEVIIRCLQELPPKTKTVLDPFMGSGTTGVACAKLGRKFIGIKIEERYFDIACKRIDDAYKQGDFFVEKPKPAKQEKLFGGDAP